MARLLSLLSVLTSAAASMMILDNPSATFEGSTITCTAAGYNGSFVYNNDSAPSETNFATYEFNVTQDGCYRLEEYHPSADAIGSCTSSNLGLMPVRVDYCRGQTAYGMINQQVNGSQWNQVGLLPFYVGWTGKIAITRQGFPNNVCPHGECFWAADAFRLTWLATSCSQAHPTGTTAPAAPVVSTTTALPAAETTADPAQTTESVVQSVEAELPAMALQIILSESTSSEAHATFSFQPPMDGCYTVEEHHPHIAGADSEELTVNYCLGQTATGQVSYSDGKHGQWNYVATLPFYDQQAASIVLPKHLLDTSKEDHKFRLTYASPSCGSQKSATYTAQLRIHADFNRVQPRLMEFKKDLSELLAPGAKIPSMRMPVSHLWEGSIVAQVTVLPAAHGHVTAGKPPTAYQAAQSLEDALASPELGQKLCSAAGSTAEGCHVKSEGFILAEPLVQRKQSAPVIDLLARTSESSNQAAHGKTVLATEAGRGSGVAVGLAAVAALASMVVVIGAGCLAARLRWAVKEPVIELPDPEADPNPNPEANPNPLSTPQILALADEIGLFEPKLEKVFF